MKLTARQELVIRLHAAGHTFKKIGTMIPRGDELEGPLTCERVRIIHQFALLKVWEHGEFGGRSPPSHWEMPTRVRSILAVKELRRQREDKI